jgi:hypothetical protein
MQRRPLGFVIAAAGLAVLVIALLGTPDASGFVLAAWILVLASVAAVAIGLAVGFRHQARLDDDEQKPSYLTADWLAGAQLFTVGEAAEPPEPEPEPAPKPEPVSADADPGTVVELEPATTTRPAPGRSPRIAAAMVAASALRELIRPGRAVR